VGWFQRNRIPAPDPGEIDAVVAVDVALAANLVGDRAEQHRAVTSSLIATKRWEAVRGFELTPAMVITVAANAAIPVLDLDLWLYRNVHWIVLRPSTVPSGGLRSGPSPGVVSDEPIEATGQAMAASGPISIAWDTALADSRSPGVAETSSSTSSPTSWT